MFSPTPEQSLAAMRGAATMYEQRLREKQQGRYWHLKNAPETIESGMGLQSWFWRHKQRVNSPPFPH